MKYLVMILILGVVSSCGPRFNVKCYYKGELIHTERTNLLILTGGDHADKCVIEG